MQGDQSRGKKANSVRLISADHSWSWTVLFASCKGRCILDESIRLLINPLADRGLSSPRVSLGRGVSMA